ncbi:MAG TPA: Hpt domain-containing protein, partial [Agitococcus sp.]|nr:Hpt domain-containing protein [Agitococcus sp.]
MHYQKNTTKIDEATLTSLGGASGLASPLVRRVITLYRQEAEKMVHGIEKAMSGGDVATAFRAAHSLKSSSASIGAHTLSEVAKQIEALLKQGQLQQAQPWLVVLRTEYTQLMDELVFFEQ